MSAKTGISWTSSTWNVLLGCGRVSSGCLHCYAIKVAARLADHPNPKVSKPYQGLTMVHKNGQLDWSGKIQFCEDRLDLPMRWQQPRRIFVNSLSDMFHPDVTIEMIARMWAVMALTPRHIYQILTKRPERILPILQDRKFRDLVEFYMNEWRKERPHDSTIRHIQFSDPLMQPISWVWLGTSVEDQAAADTRIPHLMLAPAAVRFLSVEPLLGPVQLGKLTRLFQETGRVTGREVYPLMGLFAIPDCDWEVGKIDWVIVGGESGPGFRPMDLQWAHSLREECQRVDTAFFFKQIAASRSGQGEDALGQVYHEFPRV